ncbi:DUF998 domain-containing protein [Nonomuraea zeae]|uniref:DUF998 domain-containing protein n=1 Tax=Nonomuraea zeae TaxID=1642303 RepID=A0A5S4GA16_9ACTN|nr:DUF998 domain-containing protein [Nonomuraea zeae]TMR29856.1 DUF998 domain-containing protein [Nonomuraea zeae]
MRTIAPPSPAPGPPAAEPGDRTTRRLLWCGVVAGPLFVVTFLAQGAVRDHYDWLRHPVSSLALGGSGWIQTANFIVAGLLSLAAAAGLRRALTSSPQRRGSLWGPILVGAWAVALITAGVFTTDPVSGYPPGTPDLLADYGSLHAALHDLLSLPGFVALPVACVVFAVRFARLREPGRAVWSGIAAVVFVAADVLATSGFAQNAALVAYGGLFQRVAVTAGWAWLTLLALHLLAARATPAGQDRPVR